MRSSGMPSSAATSARWAGSVKSRPPSRFVVFEKSREPIALHWPVIELAPVPGRPMLPVMSARLMAAWAVLTPWWLWLTPIVHQNETRWPRAIRSAASPIVSAPQAGLVAPRGPGRTGGRRPRTRRSPRVWSSMNARSIAPCSISRLREAVEQRQVRLRADRQVERGRHRRLGPARVDDDDLRAVRVPRDPLPEHRVGDAGVRADQDDAVRLFEVLIRVGRGVEPERLLVGHDRRGHALAGVAVAVDHAHAELRDRPEQRHLLGGDLARAQEGDRLGAVLRLDRAEPRGHRRHRLVPVDRPAPAVARRAARGRSRGRGRRGRSSASQPLGQAIPRLTG